MFVCVAMTSWALGRLAALVHPCGQTPGEKPVLKMLRKPGGKHPLSTVCMMPPCHTRLPDLVNCSLHDAGGSNSVVSGTAGLVDGGGGGVEVRDACVVDAMASGEVWGLMYRCVALRCCQPTLLVDRTRDSG